jgi:hypothetical protein
MMGSAPASRRRLAPRTPRPPGRRGRHRNSITADNESRRVEPRSESYVSRSARKHGELSTVVDAVIDADHGP